MKKCGITVKTIDKWITENDKKISTSAWLMYEKADREYAATLSIEFNEECATTTQRLSLVPRACERLATKTTLLPTCTSQTVGQRSTNNRVIADTGSYYVPAFYYAIFSTQTSWVYFVLYLRGD